MKKAYTKLFRKKGLSKEFIELLKAKGYNYKLKDETVISTDNKQVSKKYDYFENNPYNVNYQ